MTLISATAIDNLFFAIPYSQSQFDGLSNSALSRGIDLYTNKNYAEAGKEFRRAIGLSPFSENAAKAYDFTARAYLMDDNVEAAIKTYKEAIKVYPARDTFRVSLGDIYYKQGEFSEAEAEYTAAVKLNPNSPDSRYALGQLYLYSEKYSEAETHFKKVVSLSPLSTIGYYGLGQVYRKTGDFKEAIEQFNKAIAQDKSWDTARLELGFTYVDMGDTENADDMLSTLRSRGSALSTELANYIYKAAAPKIILGYSEHLNVLLGPGTEIADLDSSLTEANASKSYAIEFIFSKEMDAASVMNPFNWNISRAAGSNLGGAYNWGMPIASTEVSVPLIPTSVVYDPDNLTADVTFKITQNTGANGTIDPSHIMFRFYGKDAYGKAIDSTADEYSGISKIV